MDETWRVDWANECLWHGEAMVPLPPKVFGVLRLLVAQASQLAFCLIVAQDVVQFSNPLEGRSSCRGGSLRALSVDDNPGHSSHVGLGFFESGQFAGGMGEVAPENRQHGSDENRVRVAGARSS